MTITEEGALVEEGSLTEELEKLVKLKYHFFLHPIPDPDGLLKLAEMRKYYPEVAEQVKLKFLNLLQLDTGEFSEENLLKTYDVSRMKLYTFLKAKL